MEKNCGGGDTKLIFIKSSKEKSKEHSASPDYLLKTMFHDGENAPHENKAAEKIEE